MNANPHRAARSPGGGYTLPELLAACAVAGTLAAVAMPSYRHAMLRANRSVARTFLVNLAATQESWLATHGAFAGTADQLLRRPGSGDSVERYLERGGTWQERAGAGTLYRIDVLGASDGHARSVCGAAVGPDEPARPLAVSATAIGSQEHDRACAQFLLCFAGRPGAKGAIDGEGRETPAARGACWESKG